MTGTVRGKLFIWYNEEHHRNKNRHGRGHPQGVLRKSGNDVKRHTPRYMCEHSKQTAAMGFKMSKAEGGLREVVWPCTEANAEPESQRQGN